MAHTKAQGSSSNGRDSHGQRLGVKRFGSQFVHAGEIIVRQKGTKFLPGTNVTRASNDSLFARVDGIVTFEWAYRGKKKISVYPQGTEVKKAPAKAAAKKEVKAAAPKAKAAKPAAKKAPAKAKKTETK